MKRRLLILLFLCGILAESYGINKADSLRAFIAGNAPDTTRARAMIRLSVLLQGSNSEESFRLGKEALQIAIKASDKHLEGLAHNNLGDVYWYRSDFSRSSSEYLLALSIFEKLGQKAEIAECYRNIGWIYHTGKNNPAAMDYYRKALRINIDLGRKRQISQNYNDMAVIDIEEKRFEMAVVKLEKCLAIEREVNNREGMIAHYGNLGIAYEKLGKIEKAAECIRESIVISKEAGSKQHLAVGYCNLGSFYAKLGRNREARDLLLQSADLAGELGYADLQRDCYSNLARIDAAEGNFKGGYDYRLKASIISDTVYNNNNTRQINEMTAKYESEKKELQIRTLEKEEALAKSELEKDRILQVGLGGVGLLIIAVAFFLYRGNIQKKKDFDELSTTYSELEQKNRDITDSINYSLRIQQAIMPEPESMNGIFGESFLCYKPKDIVSGDFFWFTEQDNKKLLAVCDCTGHGVPGALMSMIGVNILNEIVRENHITSPDKILSELNEGIVTGLKQRQDGTSNRDGMDAGIISLNHQLLLEFAGAMLDCLVIRNNEAIILAGESYPVGGSSKSFGVKAIQLVAGDEVYLYTDGIEDREANSRFSKTLCEKASWDERKKWIRKKADSEKQKDDLLIAAIRMS